MFACVALAAVASGASAAVRYVATSGSDTFGGNNKCLEAAHPCRTIGHAIGVTAAGDIVSVANGTYAESNTIPRALKIVGEGAGTVLEPSSPTTQILVVDHETTLQNLRLVSGGEKSLARGEEAGTDLTLTDVVAEQTSSSVGEPAIYLPGSAAALTIEGSTIVGQDLGGIVTDGATVDVTGSNIGVATGGKAGINVTGGALRLEGSTVTAGTGVVAKAAEASLVRDVIHASGVGLAHLGGSEVTMRDSLIAPAPGGTLFYGVVVFPETAGDPTTIVGSTVYATVSGNSPRALEIEAAGGTANITVANSILASFEPGPVDGSIDIFNEGAPVAWAISHTSYTSSGGTVPDPGTGTNLAVAPTFADRAAGDYQLTEADSALIDAGDPALVLPGETDLAGAPRIAVGNCGGAAVPDLGAYEFVRTVPCPPPNPGGGGGGGGGAGGGSGGGGSAGTGSGSSGGPTVPAPGGGQPTAGAKPRLTAISVGKAKAGPILHFTLNEPAKVKVVVDRVVARKVHGHIKRALKAIGGFTDTAKRAGAQSVPLASRVGASKLTPDTYRLVLSATAGGARSADYGAGFSVAAAAHHGKAR